MREADFSKQVRTLLQATTWEFMRMNSGVIRKGSRFIVLHAEGTADWLIFPPGGVAWLETKGRGQKTSKARTEAQAAFRDRFTAIGHRYLLSDDLTEVAAWLETLK
jgi:hypothetical protein